MTAKANPTCYHIWTENQYGTSMFRFRKCFPVRGTAAATITSWKRHAPNGRGRRPATDTNSYLLLACRPHCNCPCRR